MKTTGILILFTVVLSGNLHADELSISPHMEGDVGILYEAEQIPITSEHTRSYILPYAYFDYGRFYARLDTFGVKTVPLAYGNIEVAGRVNQDGYTSSGNPALKGIADRQNSLPVGLGSFQLTPIGGLFLYAFHDMNQSGGNIFEITYAAETSVGSVTIYPEAAIEYDSKQYAQYFYGISSAESVASGLPTYVPGNAANPSMGLFVDIPIVGQWHTIFYMHRKWLDQAISSSPLVSRNFQDSGFLAVTFHNM